MRPNRLCRCLSFFVLNMMLLAPAASAQGFRPLIDHVHLAAPDPAAALAWYRQHFGGETTAEGVDRLMYGEVRVIFQKRDNAQPS